MKCRTEVTYVFNFPQGSKELLSLSTLTSCEMKATSTDPEQALLHVWCLCMCAHTATNLPHTSFIVTICCFQGKTCLLLLAVNM